MSDTQARNARVDAVFALAPVIPVLTIANLDDAARTAESIENKKQENADQEVAVLLTV